MSLEEKALVAAEAAAARVQRARIAGIAGELDGMAGIAVTEERDAVVIAGRGLARRWLDDVRLRFAIGGGR